MHYRTDEYRSYFLVEDKNYEADLMIDKLGPFVGPLFNILESQSPITNVSHKFTLIKSPTSDLI